MMYDTPYHSIPQIAQKSPMDFSMGDNSKHGCKEPQNALPQPHRGAAVSIRHLPALTEGAFKILLHILQAVAAVEDHIVLKMQIKAPVIQI